MVVNINKILLSYQPCQSVKNYQYFIALKMRTVTVPEMSVIFKQLTWLIDWEDFINAVNWLI